MKRADSSPHTDAVRKFKKIDDLLAYITLSVNDMETRKLVGPDVYSLLVSAEDDLKTIHEKLKQAMTATEEE